jgi:hypothetical protein
VAELKKVITCPSCKFVNRLGDKRCLICKAELPQTAAPGPAAKDAPARGPNPASNAAAAARAAAAKPPVGGVVRKLIDPLKKPPLQQQATAQLRRPESVTALRPALDERLLSGSDNGAETTAPPPPKPLTRRVTRPAAVPDAIAWLWCEPLPPIPFMSGKQVIVGRQDTCDLVLPHKEVSRQHAVFKVSGKQITLEDQGSSNGCYINGKRSASQVVKVGDLIQIGPYEIELRATGDDGTHDHGSDTKSFDLTSINQGGPSASMTGKLSDVSLVEILQGIEFNSKTCTLAISDGKLKGQIVFATGRPQAATFGGQRDMDAVRAMLRLKDGRFVLSNQVEPVEATMSLTVTALLLDGARELDEAGIPVAKPAEDLSKTADSESPVPLEAAPAAEEAAATSEAPSAGAYVTEAPAEGEASPAPEAYEPDAPTSNAEVEEQASEAPRAEEASPAAEAAPAAEAPPAAEAAPAAEAPPAEAAPVEGVPPAEVGGAPPAAAAPSEGEATKASTEPAPKPPSEA